MKLVKILITAALWFAGMSADAQPELPASASAPASPASGIATSDAMKHAEDTPICKKPMQCEAMWAAAADAVGFASGMRNYIVTPNRIETYPARSMSAMTGIVSKVPNPDGSYEIRLSLECSRNSNCKDLKPSATKLFNVMVNGSGIRFAD